MCVLLQAALRWPSRLVCSARPSHTVNLVGPTRPPRQSAHEGAHRAPSGPTCPYSMAGCTTARRPTVGILGLSSSRSRAYTSALTWHLGILLGPISEGARRAAAVGQPKGAALLGPQKSTSLDRNPLERDILRVVCVPKSIKEHWYLQERMKCWYLK